MPKPTDPQSEKRAQMQSMLGLASMGMELVLCMVVGAFIGYGVDFLLGSKPVGMVVGLVFGLGTGFYQMIKTAVLASKEMK